MVMGNPDSGTFFLPKETIETNDMSMALVC